MVGGIIVESTSISVEFEPFMAGEELISKKDG